MEWWEKLLREQTIPMLQKTGGSGHADAIEAALTALRHRTGERDRLAAKLAGSNGHEVH